MSRLRPILYHVTMDYPIWYNKVSAAFRGEAAQTAVNALDRALVYVVAAIYLIALAWLALNGDSRFFRAAAVPALVFAAVSIARAIIDAPRPYELFDIDPIIRKNTKGRSMPSRHVASAFIIACALAWLYAGWGAIAFGAGLVVAFTRIVGGVHFPRDVIAAIVVSTVCGFVGFARVP